jgi:Tfp pilus assembly protein PilE
VVLECERPDRRITIEIAMRRSTRSPSKGFTLVEIVIMLAITGLLVGGVLKGQEMIASARVRTLISQQDAVRVAYLGFIDRYRALPGDYNRAAQNIPGVSPGANGNNNGLISANGVAGATIDEYIAAWEHLSKSGFIDTTFTYSPAPVTTDSAPINVFGRYLQLTFDNAYGTGAAAKSHNVKTGNQIPSDLLAEVDRKIDDGIATSGKFQFSAYDGAGDGNAPTGPGTCYSSSGPALWSVATPAANCGAASLL